MQLLTYLSLVFTMFLWGGTFIAGRLLADNVAPASSAFLRFFIASLVLLIVLIYTEKKLTFPPKRTWLPLFLLGATGVFLYNVFFFFGLHHISAGRASLIIASTPLAITLCGIVFLGERPTILKACGILLSLIGALTVISNGHLDTVLTLGFGTGEKALLGCVLSWTAYSVIGKTVLKVLTPLRSVCYSSIVGTLLLFIPAAREGLFQKLPNISNFDWLCLAYLGVLGTALGFSLYYSAIAKIGATRAGIFINLVPLFGVLLSWLLLKEAVSPIVLAGGLLILAGVALTNYQPAATE
jgi:drug/metabolite transporter (DMT)-like permease